jgi:putative colanic acid biosynthesis UDP-glucose lipid carrier transferase
MQTLRSSSQKTTGAGGVVMQESFKPSGESASAPAQAHAPAARTARPRLTPVSPPVINQPTRPIEVVRKLLDTSAAQRPTPVGGASKRAFDIFASAAALVVLAPLLALIAIAVRLDSPGHAIFRQERGGFGGKTFRIWKFRTMSVTENRGVVQARHHDARITRLGSFLRRSSWDELPQLINVLLGDMALVGPRPSLPWEVEMFTAEQRRRHRCRPGITGLWQVSGRNRLSMQEMLTLDVAYAEQPSLLADLAILLRAPRAVLFDHATR